MNQQISLFTACAPWLPLDRLAPLAAAAGYAGLDLAVKPHAFDAARPLCFWNNNAAVLDLPRLDELIGPTAEALATHGLSCRVLCSYLQPDQHAEARQLAVAARRLGAPMVRIWSPAPQPGGAAQQVRATRDAWRGLAAIAAEHGIRFVLELHHRTITPGASSALRVLDGCDPAHVGVIYDVANTAIEGNEPMPLAIDLLGPYLAHVHIKDVAWQPAASWNGQDATFVPLGEGAMRWELCLAALRNAGYAGWLAIENFTELARGPERIAGDLAWLRARTQEAGHVG